MGAQGMQMAKYDWDKHHRRSTRLSGYDYSTPGAYFVTVCTQDRQCLFGEIRDDRMHLKPAGQMIGRVWTELAVRFPFVALDESVVMPNHFHGIILISGRGDPCDRPLEGEYKIRPYENDPDGDKNHPYGTVERTLGRIIQAFKSITTHRYTIGVKGQRWQPFTGRLWQRNYYEHIIRDSARGILYSMGQG